MSNFPRFMRGGAFLVGAAAILLFVMQASAQPQQFVVQLVKDINPGANGSDPDAFVTLNGVAYFRANDGGHGFELWRSDGTAAGTQLVIDLNPGAPNGFPDALVAVNGSLYFNGFDNPGFFGSEVWRSDGTAAGTILLADTDPELQGGGGFGPPLPDGFARLDANTVLFKALDPEGGLEPWKTDGTPAGTTRIVDLHPGAEWSIPIEFTALKGIAYFAADDSVTIQNGNPVYDRELFRTDGTAEGTYRVKDINPGPNPSTPTDFLLSGNFIFLRAGDGVHGPELWRTDGSDIGTFQIADLNPGPFGSFPQNPTEVHFTPAHGAFESADQRGAENARIVFQADDGTHGVELFRSDGTEAGTRLIKDINPAGDAYPFSMTNFEGRVFFSADDGLHGTEVWVTDGTRTGTRLFADINAGALRSSPQSFTVVGDHLFFVTIVPDDEHSTVQTQLWVTDGTSNGTQMVYQEPGVSYGYAIDHLTVLGDQLLFTAPNGVDADGFSSDIELFSVATN